MKRWNGRWAELAAVAGCVAFGLAILFPAAGMARGGGKAQVCMANLHIMMRSWLAYAEDNDSQIVGSATYEWNGWQNQRYPAWAPTITRRVKNFVGLPHNEAHTPSFVALADEIRGIQQGGLWPYLETERVYHCPSDTRFLKQTGYGNWGGYRSYSLGCPLNGYAYGSGGWATGEYYAAVYKTNEITSPGTKIVFVEETSGEGYNDNTWNLFLTGASFPNFWPGDPLSSLHNQRCPFSFADGHVEQHPWRDKAVIKTFLDQRKNGSATPPAQYLFGPGEGGDLSWFVRHYIPRTPQPGSGFYPLPE